MSLLLLMPFAATAFAQGGHIQGNVVDQDGLPLAGIAVTAYAYSYDSYSWEYAADVTTDASGAYDLAGLASTYFRVLFVDPLGVYLDEYYNDQEDPDWANWLWLDPDATLTGIDAAMGRPCTVSGTVTAGTGVGALSGIRVDIYEGDPWGNFTHYRSAWTDANGFYRAEGLRPGEYRVGFHDELGLYLDTYYADAVYLMLADSLYLGDGESMTGVDAVMDVWSSLSGRVTGDFDVPLQSIYVQIYASDGAGGWTWTASLDTEADGTYRFGKLRAGTYRLQYSDWAGAYKTEYYDNAASLETATDVVVGGSEDVFDIFAKLSRGGGIAGRVTNVDGVGLGEIVVAVYRYAPEHGDYWWVTQVTTSDDGTYGVGNLDAGTYRLGFFDWNTGTYLGEWYDNAEDLYVGTDISVAPDVTTSGIDAVLDKLSSISGTVTDKYGVGINGVYVELYRSDGAGGWNWSTSAYSDASGDYAFSGLGPDDYAVGFFDWSGRYENEYFDNVPDLGAATPIHLAGSQDLTGIDARLSEGGHIAGTVTNAQGTGLGEISIEVYRYEPDWDSFSYVTTLQTNPDGTYDVGPLASGAYRLGFFDWAHGEYLSEWYAEATYLDTATDVYVALDLTTGGIDVVLDRAGSISGRVTDPSGEPLEGLWVEVWEAGQEDWTRYLGGAYTGADGSYTVGQLPAADCHVVFDRWPYLTEFWNDKTSMAEADVVSVTQGGDTAGVDAQLSVGASVSGTVTGPDGLPLQGATVAAYRADGAGGWDYTSDASTDAAGLYTIGRLPDGTYRIRFDGGRSLVAEWYDNKASRATADDVAVPRDGAVVGIDAQLNEGASVRGKVTGPIGEGLDGISVALYRKGGRGYWDYYRDTSTDAGGNYTLRRLAPGTYKVGFFDWGRNDFVEEYWDDKAEFEDADTFALGFGETRSGIDAQLTRASRITGMVTDQAGGPLADIRVAAYGVRGDGEWSYISDATTDTAGEYAIKGLRAGTYRVQFRDWSGFWAPEWFDDQPTLAAADDVDVGVYVTVSGIDATLTESGKIRGTVSASDAGPLAGAHVIAYANDGLGGWEYFNDVTTDADGRYEIRGLASGEYRVGFRDEWWWWWGRDAGTYLNEFWDDKPTLAESDPVMVTAPNATESIDAVLAPGGHIEGTVTDSGSAALEDVYVIAYKDDGSGGWDYVGDTSTDASGHYDLGTLRTGTYRVQFEPPWRSEYVGEFWDDESTLGEADDVAVTAGATTSGIDAVLARASQVTGTVTLPSGDPAAGVLVTAYREDADEGWFGWADTSTDAAGAYVIKGLSAGDYRVGFRPPTTEYAFEYYDDKATLAGGDLVTVPAESVVENIDAQLGLGGGIAGVVTAGGTPRADVRVTAYAAKPGGGWEYLRDVSVDSAADGTYELGGLPAGVYRVKFNAHDPELSPEFFSDKATLATADDVTVAAGAVTPGIDADLGAAGRIAGTVTSDGGRPLDFISVSAYRDDGAGGFEYETDVTTDAGGAYVIRGLAADTYRLRFDDWYSWPTVYVSEWYHDAASLADATDVSVTAGAATVVDESLTHVATIVSLTSGTHPDESAWYSDADPALEWLAYDPGRTKGYSFVLDHSPGTAPDRLSEGAAASTSYSGLADGVWYFHVRGAVAQYYGEFWTNYVWGPVEHFALNVDTTAPTTDVTGGDDAWHAGSVGLTFTAEDAHSGMEGGLAKTEYKVDGGAWTAGTTVEVTGDGVHTVAYRSTDNAGNVEADKSVEVKVDAVAPTTTVTGADDLWHREAVALSFTATDAAPGSGMSGGLAKTEYKIDDGSWTTGTVVSVGGNGVHTVAYRSTDAAGNAETPKTATVKIDTQAPTTTQAGADGAWHTTPVTVTFTPDDGAGSGMSGGLARTEYALDGGAWTTGTSVVVSADGTHTVSYRSTDAVGNMEGEKSATVRIDGTAPTTTQTGADDLWHNVAVTVTFTPTDNADGSGMSGGLAKTEYKLDAGAWTAGTSVTVGAAGVHTILYRSTDAAGNVEADKTATVKIETTAPVTLVSGADDLWHRLPVTLTFTATDGDAGVDYTESSLDGGVTWTKGITAVVNGLAQGGSDGPRAVQFRSADLLGNTEPVQTVTVNLDTQRPTTKAPSKASVQRFRRVTLKFEVADPLPNAGKARARISIRNKNDRVVARLDWRTVTVNEVHGWRYFCKLKPGTYTFEVYARDMAGNKQIKIGSNKLTVK